MAPLRVGPVARMVFAGAGGMAAAEVLRQNKVLHHVPAGHCAVVRTGGWGSGDAAEGEGESGRGWFVRGEGTHFNNRFRGDEVTLVNLRGVPSSHRVETATKDGGVVSPA